MKRVLATALVVLPTLLPATAGAHLGDVRVYGYLDHDGSGYIDEPDSAYTHVWTHITTCRTGPKVIRASYRKLSTGGTERWRVHVIGRTWKCRFLKQRYEYSEIRCRTEGKRYVLWETAA